MQWTLAVILALFLLSGVVVPFFLRRPKDKERYAQMDDRALIEMNTRARMIKREARVTAYLSFPVLILCAFFLDSLKNVRNQLVLIAVVIFFALRTCARIFSEIEALTTTEMDFRAFRARKEGG